MSRGRLRLLRITTIISAMLVLALFLHDSLQQPSHSVLIQQLAIATRRMRTETRFIPALRTLNKLFEQRHFSGGGATIQATSCAPPP